jgi:hypothetical protein
MLATPSEIGLGRTICSSKSPETRGHNYLAHSRRDVGNSIGNWSWQDDLFQQNVEPSIICRTSQKRERIELQAAAASLARGYFSSDARIDLRDGTGAMFAWRARALLPVANRGRHPG